MKNTTTETQTSANYSGDLASTRRMLRRDLTIRNRNQLPDIKAARNMAEQLEILEQYIAQASVVNSQRSNSVRNAIASGSYMIDPQAIAEKFLEFEDELYS